MSIDLSNYDGKIVVNTEAGMRLNIATQLGIPVDYMDYSTLNDHLDIIPNTIPGDDVYAKSIYMVIGDRGHYLTADADGNTLGIPLPHDPTVVAPFRIRPLVLRPVTNDLSDAERTRYRLRKLVNINSTNYWAYYCLVLSTSGVKVVSNRVVVKDGSETITEFKYTDKELNPQPPTTVGLTTTDQTGTSDGTYIDCHATMTLSLSASDIEEYLNVCTILNGSPLKSAISEICLVAGVDTTITGQSFTGSSFTMTELAAAQVVTFISTFCMASMSNNGLGFTVEVGQTTPVPVTSA